MDDQQQPIDVVPEVRFTSDRLADYSDLAIGLSGGSTVFWLLTLAPMFSVFWFVLGILLIGSAGYTVKNASEMTGIDWSALKRDRVEKGDGTDSTVADHL